MSLNVSIIWAVAAFFTLAPLAVLGQDRPNLPTPESPAAIPGSAEQKAQARTEQELHGLVRKLGDESYEQREKAEVVLREIGLPALKCLETGLSSDDLQIRKTCRRLLNDILELDYHRRLERFLGDKDGRLEHDLPGWKRFRALAGDGAEARKLFAEMHQEEGPLLISAEAGSAALADALDLRLRSIYQAMRQRAVQQREQPSIGAVTALLFVASDPSVQLPESVSDSNYWLQILNSANYRTALAEGDTNDAVRKVFGRWLLEPSGQPIVYQKLRLATQYDLPEGEVLAWDTLQQGEQITPSYTCYAIEALGKIGDDARMSAARIAPLVADERVVSRQIVNKVRIEIQVRDVALGWLVYLTGQDHGEYNLPRATMIFSRLKERPRNYTVSYTYMRFDDPEHRAPALDKWKVWLAEHPLPEPTPVTDPYAESAKSR